MSTPTVSGLNQPMVMSGREVEDLLATSRLHHLRHVAHDQRTAGHAAQVDGLEVREQAVVALDRHHRLSRRDPITLMERPDLELIPPRLPPPVRAQAARAKLEDGDRLVDSP